MQGHCYIANFDVGHFWILLNGALEDKFLRPFMDVFPDPGSHEAAVAHPIGQIFHGCNAPSAEAYTQR